MPTNSGLFYYQHASGMHMQIYSQKDVNKKARDEAWKRWKELLKKL